MKFKANLTETGITLLEKRILPALDKTGAKTCHLYLTPTHIHFLHNLLNPSNPQSISQFQVQSLFSDYTITSRNDNLIAFSLDLSLLHRALRSIQTINTDSNTSPIQIKLVKKLTPHSTQSTPFLTLEAKGYKSSILQDVPVSSPLSRGDVSEIQGMLECAQVMPISLVKVPDLNVLEKFVDKMRNVGDVIRVSVSKFGDLHLQMETSLVTLGTEFRKLVVLGERGREEEGDREGLSVMARIERDVERGDAMSVQVSVKHFLKCLQGHLAKPDCAYYGIAPQGACLIVIFQFFVPGTRVTDKSISMHFRLPVLDSGEG